MSTISQKLLLIGCGGHARSILAILNDSDYEVAGLIDLGESFNPEETIMDVKVIGCRKSLPEFLNQGFKKAVLAIGDNSVRKELFKEVIELGYSLPSVIHSSAILDHSASIGIGNVIGPNVIIGAEVKIGSNNIVNSGAIIEHQSVIGNHCHISLSSIICGAVNIGNEVFVGANSTIIDKKFVANKTIIGAGTIVISNINKTKTKFVGNPGRVIGK